MVMVVSDVRSARGRNHASARPTAGSRFRNAAFVLPVVADTPLAVAVVFALTMSALLLNTHPGSIDGVVSWSSTNLHNLGHHPIAALVTSTFVLPGNAIPELVVVAISFAALERTVGARRTAIIAMTGQLIATLITEYGAGLGAHWGWLAASSSTRPDVGVSYAMYAVLAAGIALLSGRTRLLALLALTGWVVAALALDPEMTSTGHVLSVATGVVMATYLKRARSRPTSLPA